MVEDTINKEALDAIIAGVVSICQQFARSTTTVYDGIIVSNNADAQNKWEVKYNGKTHNVKPYGDIVPKKNKMVKVIIPQGNQALAFFI